MSSFTLKAGPNTDIWRKPPGTNVFSAPTGAPEGATTRGPLSAFVSARASFSFAWTEQYDQGGLLLAFRRAGAESSDAPPEKWIKTGVELYNGAPMLSTVACDRWADWSVTPLVVPSPGAAAAAGAETWTTIAVEKAVDHHGTSLWVYHVREDGAKVPLREVCWAYGDGDAETWELEVLGMAARPEQKAESSLEVALREWEVKWSQ